MTTPKNTANKACRHLLRADPAPLSFKTPGGGGGWGGVAYKDPARLPPPPPGCGHYPSVCSVPETPSEGLRVERYCNPSVVEDSHVGQAPLPLLIRQAKMSSMKVKSCPRLPHPADMQCNKHAYPISLCIFGDDANLIIQLCLHFA